LKNSTIFQDIRAIEIETAAILNETMRAAENGLEANNDGNVKVENEVRPHCKVFFKVTHSISHQILKILERFFRR